MKTLHVCTGAWMAMALGLVLALQAPRSVCAGTMGGDRVLRVSGRLRVVNADPSKVKLGANRACSGVRRGSRQLCPVLHWSTLPLG